ncbi:Asp-tRNA(Asn)/Glu-tRNA(Gln) amidotransferase A subunit family amidase [Pontibacter ummariensis]|uniref:Asp-tRNAAsn/Glu-tRNAGln amidotransferase A subunit n=1 Tax=Pontibacter ummariensis TaxID=1610492 RepID=A0A239HA73_9BACT|nr:amidase [Pontibacter ummariensis]PRY10681.1 Asp-tRNA(Asn)/Glu-tRNA(Gln) amidotransferase A subunit family amidase [Pontibacter ummariensis]SNS78299.1 Asp-tRNAAsn/Glu-tRNAGln amidotransferase A subunit [Pontibacter ummariensis]
MRKSTLALLGTACFVSGAFVTKLAENTITIDMMRDAQNLMGLHFTDAQLDSARADMEDFRKDYETIRKQPLSNDVAPALMFNPIPVGFAFEQGESSFEVARPAHVKLPKKREELAFYTVPQLAELVRTQQITSEELTRFYLERLKKYGPTLECVTTLTEELALQQARQADKEIKAGKYKGMLHGIPFGVKDLLSTKKYKTTWGAMPYKDQVIDEDATVVQRLQDAGGVLVAKLTLGALAMGDVWYGGKTRSPWDLTKGSSGSSAGSASAVAAGLLPYAIGTETLGSIVSPSTACGTTGLRPTFGRVSRSGAMALSWSMDKIGPIARSAEDCAIVFNAIYGPDGKDQSVYDVPFNYNATINPKKLRVGYLKNDFDGKYGFKETDQATLQVLRDAGVELVPIELPDLPARALTMTISVEGAAAFDELTRSGRDSLLVAQHKYAWPNTFRGARFIPAVEYLQAQRVRTLLVQQMQEKLKDVDVYISPSFASSNLVITNLTGHPCVVVPNGFQKNGMPTTITFMGKLFGEAELLSFSKFYQDLTNHEEQHPNLNFTKKKKA